ncbi:oligopeptide/dipeptide ABC transporter ATP-binding protein, partial [Deinococcus xinjiangensis]|uniref:oligopeptide/dipeptide ABC transporter ATP-binding protein n=1 Tax=Deinococcus xinjiangensis TaxID=457454 RepID=UPI0033659F56
QRIILEGDIPSPINPPSGCVFRTRCRYAIAECANTVPELREVAPDHFKACIRDDIL